MGQRAGLRGVECAYEERGNFQQNIDDLSSGFALRYWLRHCGVSGGEYFTALNRARDEGWPDPCDCGVVLATPSGFHGKISTRESASPLVAIGDYAIQVL